MQFNRGRMAKLAGLLREGKEDMDEADEAEVKEAEQEEGDKVDEAEMDECGGGMYEIDEAGMDELEESFDLRKAIRDEIKRSLSSRDDNTSRYTSGQVFGKRSRNPQGTVTMGFPGIGFKR